MFSIGDIMKTKNALSALSNSLDHPQKYSCLQQPLNVVKVQQLMSGDFDFMKNWS